MADGLFETSVGFSDEKVHYLSGAGSPMPGEKGDTSQTQAAPIGSSYSDTDTGEKWTKTVSSWRKLALAPVESMSPTEDATLHLIFEHLNRLLICAAMMVGGAAVAKFKMYVTPSYPWVSIVVGIIIALIGLFLAAWVTSNGWIKIGRTFGKGKGFLYGALYVFLALCMVMAMFFAATSA